MGYNFFRALIIHTRERICPRGGKLQTTNRRKISMKKLFIGMAAGLMLMFLFAGCQKEAQTTPSASETESSQSIQETQAQTEETLPEGISDMIINPVFEGSAALDAFMAKFEVELGKDGMTLADKTPKDAKSFGAAAGYGYMVNGFGFEIYIFDPASGDEKTEKNLKTAKDSGYITIFGAEINGKELTPKCAVSDNIVLIFPGEEIGLRHPNKDAIIKAFLNVKM